MPFGVFSAMMPLMHSAIDIDIVKAITTLAGGLLIGLVILVLRHIFPWRPLALPAQSATPTKAEYYKAQLLFGFFFLASLAIVGSALWFGYGALTSHTTDAQHVVRPSVWAFAVCGFFTTLGVGGLLSYFLMRCALDEQADRILQISSQKMKMNVAKIFLGVYTVNAIIGIGLTISVASTYLRIEENKVALNDFWSFSEVMYTLDQIKSVSYEEFSVNRQGEVSRRPHYKVTFCDGRIWTTKQFPFGLEDVIPHRAIFKQLNARSSRVQSCNDAQR